jgi:hypothetical protein
MILIPIEKYFSILFFCVRIVCELDDLCIGILPWVFSLGRKGRGMSQRRYIRLQALNIEPCSTSEAAENVRSVVNSVRRSTICREVVRCGVVLKSFIPFTDNKL